MKKENDLVSANLDSDKPRVDVDCLIDKLGGNNKQVLRCLEIFKDDLPPSLEIIKTGLKNKEVKEAKNSCHGLRGMLLTMEMKKAASTANLLETSIIEKRFEISLELLPLLEREIEAALNLIENSISMKE
jgi:HPt (histidine-containing phosphotransfer) domain-containing protein